MLPQELREVTPVEILGRSLKQEESYQKSLVEVHNLNYAA